MELRFLDVDLDGAWLRLWLEAVGVDVWDVHIIVAHARHKRELCSRGYKDQYPGDNAFRGLCCDSETPPTIYVFWDCVQTPDSILWLIMHELVHMELRRNRKKNGFTPILYALGIKCRDWLETLGVDAENYANDPALQTRDDLHEADPEEVFANDVATTIVGACYDRAWWRSELAKVR